MGRTGCCDGSPHAGSVCGLSPRSLVCGLSPRSRSRSPVLSSRIGAGTVVVSSDTDVSEGRSASLGSDDDTDSPSSEKIEKAKKRDHKEKKTHKRLKKNKKKLKKRRKKLMKKEKRHKQKEERRILSAMREANLKYPGAAQSLSGAAPQDFIKRMLEKVPPAIASTQPPSVVSRMAEQLQLPASTSLGTSGLGKPQNAKVDSVAKGLLQVFRCKCCERDCSGEASFLQHVQGRKHRAKAGGGFAGLLPNDMGVVPTLSDYAQQLLGRKAAAMAAVQAASPEAAPQETNVCLRQLAEAVQCTKLVHRISTSRSPSRSSYHPAGHRQCERRASVPPLINGEAQPHMAARRSLPIFLYRREMLERVDNRQVTILEGDTGCGKTTQAPQYLLEDAAQRGRPCYILCTQPRRLAAIGVATRVAEERGLDDGELGATIGYAVQHEHRASNATCLLFCTTGVALRRLQSNPQLQGVTHVVVDEVHERSVESDLLLLLLKQVCCQRKDLRLLLMSATIDSDLFATYFGAGSSSLKVPGRLFPVETYFLEDALKLTCHIVDSRAEWAKGGGPCWREKRQPADPETLEEIDSTALDGRYSHCDDSVRRALEQLEPDALNVDLVAELVASKFRVDHGGSDAVLVFVSGVKEIEQVIDAILARREFLSGDARRWVLPLHGGLPYEEQAIVFQRPPRDVRKIVVATNVAETSVTIDDIGLVIDTGRMKENRYDGVRMMASLEDVVVSRANARQRRGRAGRVGPGVCVHLVTKHRHDELLHDHQLPEVKRTPLEKLVLRVLDSPLARKGAAAVCALLLEPPDAEAVHGAVAELEGLGAIEHDGEGGERLTALGKHLAALPLDPRLGKLIVMSVAFGGARATDDAMTIAAALASRSPFLTPREGREEADKSRVRWSRALAPGEGMHSDHLAVVAAYETWDKFPSCAKLDFAKVNFLSHRTLQAMQRLKRQLLEQLSTAELVCNGLRARDVEEAGRLDGSDGVLATLERYASKGAPRIPDAQRPKLLAGLLCAALCPNVVHGSEPGPKRTKAQGTSVMLGPRATLHIRERSSGARVQVQIHASSVHGGASWGAGIGSPYLVYNELVNATGSLRVRDVTPVSPLALVLFGGHLEAVDEEPGVLSICGWLRLRVPEQARDQLLRVRRALDKALQGRIAATPQSSAERRSRYSSGIVNDDGAAARLFESIVALL